jgi:hypothetical protein
VLGSNDERVRRPATLGILAAKNLRNCLFRPAKPESPNLFSATM